MNRTLHDLTKRIMFYYAEEDPSQICHTQCVANYTRLIAEGENYLDREIHLLEIAAWLHDIGCPAARVEYGNSKPVHQQAKGEEIARQWLADYDALTADEKEWIANTVGTHHQFKYAQKFDFQPLFEADLIVNLFEGYFKRDLSQHYYDKLMRTETGKKLYKAFFLK